MPRDIAMVNLDLARTRLDLALWAYLKRIKAAFPVGSLVEVHDLGYGSIIRAEVTGHGNSFRDFQTLYVVNTKTGKPRQFYLGCHRIELISRCTATEGGAA